MNVLKEALPFETNHKSRRIGREKKNLKHKSYDSMDLIKLAQKIPGFVFFFELKDMSS